ncbi:MAG: class I SAM-dependent methyltransferase [Gemmatimonadaceae bacterium]
MISTTSLMENPLAYRLWQAPFAERKLEPLFAHNDLGGARRVLDVGCGPGTNARHFSHTEYVGVDVNQRYIEHARRSCTGTFLVADAAAPAPLASVGQPGTFDFVLANSLLHHLDTASVESVLRGMRALLGADGYVHILDLVLPEQRCVARALARWDRGEYPRMLAEWRDLLVDVFEPVVFEPYPLKAWNVTLWSMLYFKGRAR